MPSLPIRNLVQGQGVNYDKTPNSLPPNSWTEVINARFTRGRMERFGGTQVFAETPGTPELAGSRFAKGITRGGQDGLLVATATNVYLTFNGTTFQDVTPLSGYADTRTWNLRQYGDTLILSSLDTEPFVLETGAGVFQPFANWPAGYQAQVVFAYKNILIGLGIEISNQPQSGLVIWSDVVDPANVTNVAWDPADPTTVAGENVLPDADGNIRDGGVLRDSAMIYTDSSVWRADLANTNIGAAAAVFNFRKLYSDDGIYKNRCFVETNGVHFVVGLYDFYINDGFNKRTVSDNRFTEFLYSRLGVNAEIFIDHYQRPQELIISYGVDSDLGAREALVYNYFYDTVSRWIFSETGGFYSHFTLAPDFGQSIPSWADLQSQNVRWSDLNSTTWNQLFPQTRERVPYVLGYADDKLYRADVGGAASSVTPSEVRIERIDLDLDEAFNGTRPIKHISSFLPQVVGEGQLRIQFGGRNALGSQILWQPERTYDITSDYKFDVRISTRFPAIRILQDAADGTLALDGYDLIVKAESKR